jgi:hypothetical protein
LRSISITARAALDHSPLRSLLGQDFREHGQIAQAPQPAAYLKFWVMFGLRAAQGTDDQRAPLDRILLAGALGRWLVGQSA